MAAAPSYELLIAEAIAASIGIPVTHLRGLPTISALPSNDYVLFQLLDCIPSRSPRIEDDARVPRLSTTFGTMLNSMPDSLIVSLAQKNYANATYWLPADPQSGQPKTPIYVPSSSAIVAALANGSTLQYTLDSSNYPPALPTPYPAYPDMVVNSSFLAFNQTAEHNRFIFTMRFATVASPPVSAGGWFSQAAFASGYQSHGKGWKTGPGTVTWDELFGTDGILQFVCNGLLAVSGITLTLQCFGSYDQDTLDALQQSNGTVVWPYYLNVPDLTQNYALGTDGSITITTSVPAPNVLLFLLTAAPIATLVGTGE